VGDRLIDASVSGPSLVKVYASSYSSGQKGLVLVNTGTTQQVAIVTIKNATVGSRYYWYTMVGGTDNGEFSRKVYINNQGPTEISGGPANSYTSVKPYSASTTNGIRIALPARSVVYAVVD
ncbi:MAG: alpha-L-arabinofuranosidase, partial [Flavisolibacter sp.]